MSAFQSSKSCFFCLTLNPFFLLVRRHTTINTTGLGKVQTLLYKLLTVVGEAIGKDCITAALMDPSMGGSHVTDQERIEFVAGLSPSTDQRRFHQLCEKVASAYRR
jgi:hypothetical protein